MDSPIVTTAHRSRRFAGTVNRLVRAFACAALVAATADAAVTVDAKADTVLAALKSADFRALSGQMCSGSRLTYSPYARNLSTLPRISFARPDVAAFGSSRKKYVWGAYDGSGDPIRLTPREYHKEFVYDVDYQSASAKTHLDRKAFDADKDLAALAKAYPAAEIVTYKFAGTSDASYKDARGLILVFEQRAGNWCLRAVAHDEAGV